MMMMTTISWILKPYILVGRCQRFGETLCLYIQYFRAEYYISPKCWHCIKSLHDARTEKNNHHHHQAQRLLIFGASLRGNNRNLAANHPVLVRGLLPRRVSLSSFILLYRAGLFALYSLSTSRVIIHCFAVSFYFGGK
jgi:hypothetical protein